MANYRDMRGTNKQVNTNTHRDTQPKYITFPFQNHNQPEMFRLPTVRDTHTSDVLTVTLKTHCMQIKETALRVRREQDGYNNRNSVGSSEKHACYH